MYALKHDLMASLLNEPLLSEIIPDLPQDSKFIKNDILNKNRLIRSFCPKIKKKYYAKLFMLLALVSGTSYLRNNAEVRAQIHMLFVGPSGSHKFDLMRAASSVVSESKYIPLSENLGHDFVFTMSKKQDTVSFEAGAFLMGNKDVTFVHDINLVNGKNKELLNDILFGQKVKKYFENANYEISVKTSIIASCEPLFRAKAKERTNQDIATSCGVAEGLLNLFDAVVNLDIGNNDEEINFQITHLIKFYTEKPPFGGCAKSEEDDKKGKKDIELLTEEQLREYLEDCKKIRVRVCQRAYAVLFPYLKQASRAYSSTELERLVRFTQAHAKLLGRSCATVYDVVSVITLLESNDSKQIVDNAKEKILIKTLKEYEELELSVLSKLDLYDTLRK